MLFTNCRDEFLQMILQTDRVVVRHVYEREVHRFQSHDGWVINFINYVDHIIDCPVAEQKTTIPSGHECQEIEVRIYYIYTPLSCIILILYGHSTHAGDAGKRICRSKGF